MLSTGEVISKNKFLLLPLNEQKDLAAVTAEGSEKSYFAISVPWLNETCDVNFANSWIFASACQSAMFTSGPKSLSEAFLNLGAGGYNGFSDIIKGPIADQIAVLMTDKFSSGLSFNDASDKVRDDFSLLLESWFLRLVLSNTDIGLFSNNQNSNDPFYLIAPSKPS